jgi:hypothetical protein
MALGGIILALSISWLYTFITFAYMPVIMFGFGVFGV